LLRGEVLMREDVVAARPGRWHVIKGRGVFSVLCGRRSVEGGKTWRLSRGGLRYQA
jgi:hypothetical protein